MVALSTSHDSATQLLATIEQMGAGNSNPVLEVLDGNPSLLDHKYPQGELLFNNNGWRGFYHCHQSPDGSAQEHGHFHLFVRCGKGNDVQRDWCHVVALSMDYDGQPIAWHCANQWVTGGAWFEADTMKAYLETIRISPDLSILEAWLMGMVSLFRDNIAKLLYQRDTALQQWQKESDVDNILLDRQVYILASTPILLTETLQNTLLKKCSEQGG